MEIQSAYRQEQEKLEMTFEEIRRQQASIGPRYFGKDYVEQLLDAKREETRERLNLLTMEPYFGRLDFQETGQENPMPLYIGKRGMEHADTGKPYIIDWRAPVAGLFYSFTGGEEAVEYEAPDGIIDGFIHRKRNLAIRDKTLQRVVDSYVRGGDNLGVSDEFLLYRLGENKDNRLRDIVSTIQAEQDQIIRAPKDKALIIQGAAGSGKTTVALHRLAYLLYRYRDEVKAENMIIFAPNLMFLDYISGVLPELGVGNIRQTTFAEWALELLEQNVKLRQNDDARWFSLSSTEASEGEETHARFKGSLAYKNLIEEKLSQYENALQPDQDFEPWEGKKLSVSMMQSWLREELARFSLFERRGRLIARIRRWLEMTVQGIPSLAAQKERSKLGKQRLNAFVKRLPIPDPVQFYKQLFGAVKQAVPSLDLKNELTEELYKSTQAYLKRGEAAYEDLPALLWIRRAFKGDQGHRFDHVVIDEAQDASPFQVALLHAHARATSFTILGDLAQGIHDYRGIRRWEEFYPEFEAEEISYHQLRQSYRSTTEIIEFANTILRQAETELPEAVPVFRSGEPVEVVQVGDPVRYLDLVRRFIDTEREKGWHTIAVITRTSDEGRALHEQLKAHGTEALLIEEGEHSYKGGISIVPAHLSKGLEFDAVLLADVSSTNYPQTARNAKLLYVACTRALHTLKLLYRGERSRLLD